jgi:hypothetical protein
MAILDNPAESVYTSGTQQNDRPDEVGCTRCPPLFLVDGVKFEPSLKGLYDVIQKALLPPLVDNNETDPSAAAAAAETIAVIDDIMLLFFVGISDTAITRFIRALRALCRHHVVGLIICAHAAAPVPHNAESSIPFGSGILRALIESSYWHAEVRPLANGRSGAISGKVAVHLGGLGSGDGGMEGGRVGERRV